jgi:hypothetical protein
MIPVYKIKTDSEGNIMRDESGREIMQFICYEIPVEPLILIPEYNPEEVIIEDESFEEEILKDDLITDLDSTQNP